ncbi:MAG: methionyl-tRNA formyltransferase [Candidatus Marinamargulisbacteria bacterium]|jgi:methionyl-tRNA formyltransferase
MLNTCTFVLLMGEEHPVGRQMFTDLESLGFVPTVIIQEKSPFSHKKRSAYELASRNIPRLIGTAAKAAGVPVHFVENINNEKSVALIKAIQPDLILLGNTRLIKPEIFNLAKSGCLNVHPGVLPQVRGSYPVVWSLHHGQPLGCTLHFIDEGIDTGRLVKISKIQIDATDTLESLIEKTIYMSSDLFVLAMRMFAEGTLVANEQDLSVGNCYTWPDAKIIDSAKRKLSAITARILATAHVIRA